MKNTVAKIGEKVTSPILIIFFNNIQRGYFFKCINIQAIYMAKIFLNLIKIISIKNKILFYITNCNFVLKEHHQ